MCVISYNLIFPDNLEKSFVSLLEKVASVFKRDFLLKQNGKDFFKVPLMVKVFVCNVRAVFNPNLTDSEFKEIYFQN